MLDNSKGEDRNKSVYKPNKNKALFSRRDFIGSTLVGAGAVSLAGAYAAESKKKPKPTPVYWSIA